MTATAETAAASAVTGSQGEKPSTQVVSHNGYGSVLRLAQALAALTISGEAPDAAMRISSSLLACGNLHCAPIADALLTSNFLAPPGLEQPPDGSWQPWKNEAQCSPQSGDNEAWNASLAQAAGEAACFCCKNWPLQRGDPAPDFPRWGGWGWGHYTECGLWYPGHFGRQGLGLL